MSGSRAVKGICGECLRGSPIGRVVPFTGRPLQAETRLAEIETELARLRPCHAKRSANLSLGELGLRERRREVPLHDSGAMVGELKA